MCSADELRFIELSKRSLGELSLGERVELDGLRRKREEIAIEAVKEAFTIKDSGRREDFTSGAVRDTSDGKGRFDLLPAYAIRRIAKHFEAGAKKYAERNWEKGIPLHRFMDSALRHLFCYQDGQRDEDHLAAAAWNLLCLIETEERVKRGVLPADLLTLAPAENYHKDPKNPS